MNIGVMSAGGYGSRLQTGFIRRYILPEAQLVLLDDFKSEGEVLRQYKHLGLDTMKFGDYSSHFDILVPSYEYQSLINTRLFKNYTFNLNNKKNITSFFPPEVIIPTYLNSSELREALSKNVIESDKIVAKRRESSGGKGVAILNEVVDPMYDQDEYIFQEYCPGDEMVVDCLCITSEGLTRITFTSRKSEERINGRDSVISFDISSRDDRQVAEALSKFNNPGYNGFFNVQFRKHKDRWKVMEIDFRLSGSSIVNKNYEPLMRKYIHDIKIPSISESGTQVNVYSLIGRFNDEFCKSVYEDIGLSLPSIV